MHISIAGSHNNRAIMKKKTTFNGLFHSMPFLISVSQWVSEAECNPHTCIKNHFQVGSRNNTLYGTGHFNDKNEHFSYSIRINESKSGLGSLFFNSTSPSLWQIEVSRFELTDHSIQGTGMISVCMLLLLHLSRMVIVYGFMFSIRK